MGLYPPTWGYHQWTMLHLMAHVYPENPNSMRQESMLKYLQGMSMNMPCPGCVYHYVNYFKSNPPKVESRTALKKYLVDFHNEVNKRTGKRTYTYEEAEEDLKEKCFKIQDWMDIKRATDIRQEDAVTIKKLKSRCSELEKNSGDVIAVIVLSVLLVGSIGVIIWLLYNNNKLF